MPNKSSIKEREELDVMGRIRDDDYSRYLALRTGCKINRALDEPKEDKVLSNKTEDLEEAYSIYLSLRAESKPEITKEEPKISKWYLAKKAEIERAKEIEYKKKEFLLEDRQRELRELQRIGDYWKEEEEFVKSRKEEKNLKERQRHIELERKQRLLGELREEKENHKELRKELRGLEKLKKERDRENERRKFLLEDRQRELGGLQRVDEGKEDAVSRIYTNVKPLIPISAVLILLFTFALLLPLRPTGFVTVVNYFDYTDNISLDVNSSYEYTWFMGNYGELKSVRLDGSVSEGASAKVYLEYYNESYLVFDSSRLDEEGILDVTGLAVRNESESINDSTNNASLDDESEEILDISGEGEPINNGSNESIINETDEEIINKSLDNKIIKITTQGGGSKNVEDVFEFNVSSSFNWGVSYDKLCTKWDVNDVSLCYGSEDCCALLNLDSSGSWNDTFYLSYGRYDSSLENTVKAQVVYADYSLDIENPYSDIVYSSVSELEADFYYERVSFEDVCIETCLLPSLNASLYKLRFVVSNGSLIIDNIRYSVEKEINISENAPVLVNEFEDVTVYKNEEASINLSNYFFDEDGDNLTYAAYEVENISVVVRGSVVRLVPDYNFTGRRYVYFVASDGYYNVSSNLFSVNVVEKPLSISEVNVSEELVKPSIVINKPVRWVKKVNVSGFVINLTVNISSDALNVTVRDVREDRVVSSDKIKVNDKGVIKNLTTYEAEKRVEQIDKISDKLSDKKAKVIGEDPTAMQEVGSINRGLIELQNEKNELTGYTVASKGKGLLTRFFEWLFDIEITGYAVYEPVSGNESNVTSVIIEDIVSDVEVEYWTEAPIAEEEEITNGKRVVISSDVHYSDILAYTYLDDVPEAGIKLYRIVNESRELVDNVSYYDENNNGLIDYIEWIVPSLSNETYEVSITVLNVQSYPMVGGNWTVRFETIGAGDLRIKAVNGTAWSDIDEENDLRFLEVRCGDDVLEYSWVDDSVFIANYSCDLTGHETSKVLTAGVHHLEFDFNGQNATANNFATVPSNASQWTGTFDRTRSDGVNVTLLDNPKDPTLSELPNNQAEDWANMTGNVLLMHFNNESAFGENDTHVYDFSGIGNNGSCTNCPTWNESGKINGSFEFDGDDYVDVGDIDYSSWTNITISGWGYINSPGSTHNLLLGNNIYNAKNGFSISYYKPTEQLYFYHALSSSLTVSVSENEWFSFAFVINNGSSMEGYLNGIKFGTISFSGIYLGHSIDNYENNTVIGGGDLLSTKNWKGTIDEVAIWNRSLNATEISTIYENQKVRYYTAGNYTSPVIDSGQGNVTWVNITWVNVSAATTNISFHVRSCDDAGCDTEDFIGPDYTNNTYFTVNSSLNTTLTPSTRYIQYKAFFKTGNVNITPYLQKVVIGYENINELPTQSVPYIGAELETPLNSSIVGYWKLNRYGSSNESQVLDETGVNNGTLYNFDNTSLSGPSYEGRVGGAWEFDGVDDYIEVPHNANQLLTQGGSISAWIYAGSAGPGSGSTTGGRVIDKSTSISADDGFTFYTSKGTPNTMAFRINEGTIILSGTNSIPFNTWTHVLVTFNASGFVTHYVNGVVSGTPANTNSSSGITTTNALRIGNRATSTNRPFNGTIDEVIIYNVSLSADEIMNLYLDGLVNKSETVYTTQDLGAATNNTADDDSDNLTSIFNWYEDNVSIAVLNMPFDSNSTIKDYSGRGNTGTLGDGSTASTFPFWNATGGIDKDIPNVFSGAYEFDGVDDYVEVAYDSSLNITSDLTVEAWIKPTGLGAGTIVDAGYQYTGVEYGWIFYYGGWETTSGYRSILFASADGSGNYNAATYVTSLYIINEDVWTHVVAVKDGTNITLYRNGVNIKTGGVRSASISYLSGRNVRIGLATDTNHFTESFNGTIDEVAIYNRSLSAEEIYQLYLKNYNVLVSEETTKGKSYHAEVTVNDGTEDSSSYNTTEITILNSLPTHTTPILNSSLGTNLTTEYLQCFNQTTSDADTDNVIYNYKWFKDDVLDAIRFIDNGSLVLNMPFDDNHSSDNITRDYALGNDGTVVNGTTWNASGKIGGAYEFDGVDDYVEGTSLSNLPDTIGSMSLWVYPETVGTANGYFIELSDGSSDNRIIIYLGSSGNALYIYAKGGGSGTNVWSHNVATDILANDQWQHLEATWDTTTDTYQIHIDNNLITPTSTGSAGDPTGINQVNIGSAYDGLTNFNGIIDEVQIYNRSLSADEISQIYYATKDGYAIMNSSQTAEAEVWRCEMTPYDYEGAGDALNSSGLTIENTAPTHSTPFIATELETPLNESIVGYWKLNRYGDNNTNTVVDETGVNNGTPTNFDNTSSSGPSYEGRMGGAWEFDGVDDYVEVLDDSSLKFDDSITVSAWVKYDSLFSWQSIVHGRSILGSWSSSYWLATSSNNLLRFNLAGTSTTSSDATVSLSTNTWYHIVGTYNGSDAKIYLDGSEIKSWSTDGSITGENGVRIGLEGSGNYHFNGTIDEVIIWNVSLSADKIMDLYLDGYANKSETVYTTQDLGAATNNTADDDSDNLTSIFNWYEDNVSIAVLNMPFDSNSTIKDYSGRGNTGTLGDGSTASTFPFWNATGGIDKDIPNVFSGAYEFDGVDDYVEISENDIFDFVNQDFSAEVWIKPSIWGSFPTLLDFESTGWNGWMIRYDGGIRLGSKTGEYHVLNTQPSLNEWSHIIITYSESNQEIKGYLNGVLGKTVSIDLNITPSTANHGIGNNIEITTQAFNGTIDEVAIYNRSLSAEEIYQLYLKNYNILVSEETTKGKSYHDEVTVNDGTEDSSSYNTSEISVLNSLPTHTTPILNSSLGTNLTTEYLQCFNQSTSDSDGDNVIYNYKWFKDDVLDAIRFIDNGSLVLNMPFDNNPSSDNITRDYALGNDGTVKGGASWNASGKIGGAFEFDGVDDYVDLGNDSSLNITEAVTLSAWVKGTSFTTWDAIVGKWQNDHDGYALYTGSSATHALVQVGVGAQKWQLEGSITINDGNWHHIIGTYDGITLKLYVDSVLDDSNTDYSGSIDTNAEPVRIGARNVGNDKFTGTIDEVAIYNRSLSADEISQIYYATKDGYAIMNSSQTAEAEVWRCEMTPYDYEEAGDALNSSGLTIENTAPTHSTPFIAAELETPLNESIVGYWKLNRYGDNNTNTVVDETGVNNGTPTNFDNTSLSGPSYEGRVGGAWEFDGVDDYVNIPSRVSIFNQSSWTISTGFKSEESRSVYSDVYLEEDTNNDYAHFGFYKWEVGKWSFRLYDGTSYIAKSTSIVNDGKWHHAVASNLNGTVSLYIDGVYENSISDVPTLSSTLSQNKIGLSEADPAYFNGTIDEVIIWNVSLSADKIMDLYLDGYANKSETVYTTQDLGAATNNTADDDSDNLTSIFNWYEDNVSIAVLNMPFDSNSTIKDYSGRGNTGTLGDGSTASTFPFWNATGGIDKDIPNVFSGAYEFDGVDDYVKISDDSSLQLGSKFTISLWMKGKFDGGDVFSVKASSGFEALRINANTGDVFTLQLTNSSNDRAWSSSTSLTNNTWYIYTFTFDGGIVTQYINGVYNRQDDHSATHSSLKSDQTDVLIGSRTESTSFFNGTIDEVAIYNRSLSAQEIYQLYLKNYNILVSQETTKNKTYKAAVTLNDGQEDSSSYNTTEITILNSAPTITINSPADDDHNRVNITVDYTPNDADSDSLTCYLYVNGTINQTNTTITLGSSNTIISNISRDGVYEWYINCTDGEDYVSSTPRTYTLDTVDPILTIHSPANGSYHNSNFDINVSAVDGNLYILNYTFYLGSTIYQSNQTNCSNCQYFDLNDTIDITALGLSDGNYSINFSVSDSHTGKAIGHLKKAKKGDYVFLVNDSSKNIEYNMSVYYIKGNDRITPPPPTSSYMLFNDDETTISFGINFTADRNGIKPAFKVMTKDTYIKIFNSSYKGHLIWYPYSTDFEGTLLVNNAERNYTVNVTRISDYEADVKIETTPELDNNDEIELRFDSIVGLNIVERHYEVTIDTVEPKFGNNKTNATATTPKYKDVVQINLTLTNENLDGYFFAHNDTGTMQNGTYRDISGASHIVIENISIENLKYNDVLGWQVWVNDTAGNINVSGIYTLVIRNTILTINTVTVSPTIGAAGTVFNITANVSDNFEIDTVTAYVQKPDENNIATITLSLNNGIYNGSWDSSGKADGTYVIDVAANDTAGNEQEKENWAVIALSSNAENVSVNSSLVIVANESVVINAVNEVDTWLNITTSANVTASIVIAEYSDNMESVEATGVSELGKYISIVVDNDTNNNISFAEIRVYYTDAKVTAANLQESTLRLYKFNSSSALWYVISPGGVDTVLNYVWGNVSSFSSFGVFGDTIVSSEVSEAAAAERARGLCTAEWDCGEWGECLASGVQKRECVRIGTCFMGEPEEERECDYTPPEVIKPKETCFDSIKNQNEEDIDCGGVCKPCKVELPAPKKLSIFKKLILSLIVLIVAIIILFDVDYCSRKEEKKEELDIKNTYKRLR